MRRPSLRRSRTRVLAVAALVWLAAAGPGAAATGDTIGAPKPEVAGPALLPDAGGPLRRVVLSVSSARRAALRNADLVTNIVNGLPERTEVLILTNDPSAFTVARNPWPGRVRFRSVPQEHPLTIWTQDPFLVLAAGPRGMRPLLLASRTFERADDRVMAEAVAEATGFRLRSSAFSFAGGNVVSDDQAAFVGADTVRRNAVELGMDESEVVRGLEEELGRRVVVIGPAPQPIAHIDMMLTPLGRGRLMLADTAAGAAVAEAALSADPAAVAAFEREARAGFFGHPVIRHIEGRGGVTLEPPALEGRTQPMAEVSRLIAPSLDAVAAALEGYGYAVYRVPLLYGGPAGAGDERPQAGYPMLTYNNVLVEDGSGGPVVYLPRYGLEAMDRAAAEAWRAAGFQVQAVTGLTSSAMYGGALRCAVKVLERDPN